MSFLPSSYKVPVSSGNYFKLQDGENTFRVLSSAIIGWEYWTTVNKPVRNKEKFNDIPEDIKIGKDGKISIKHFWAFVVWDYQDKAIKILEITQQTIQKPIKALVDNPKWGDPKKYDISITRSGEGFETEYSVMPNPHTEIKVEVQEAYKNKSVNLEALYSGKDPFQEGKKAKEIIDIMGGEELPV